MQKTLDKVAQWIKEAKHVVVFTGAGISTESGIPDFRSPGGVWNRFDPDEFSYSNFVNNRDHRIRSWAMSRESWSMMNEACPNAAHLAIAEWDKMGKLEAVITQNIDNLHQKAGVPESKVVQVHGTESYVRCLSCSKRYSREEIQDWLIKGVAEPRCEDCGGILKTATISFGEPMPEVEWEKAVDLATHSDVFVVIGTSLVVYPAAQVPLYAEAAGSKLVIVNNTPTPQDDKAGALLTGQAGDIMTALTNVLKQIISF